MNSYKIALMTLLIGGSSFVPHAQAMETPSQLAAKAAKLAKQKVVFNNDTGFPVYLAYQSGDDKEVIVRLSEGFNTVKLPAIVNYLYAYFKNYAVLPGSSVTILASDINSLKDRQGLRAIKLSYVSGYFGSKLTYESKVEPITPKPQYRSEEISSPKKSIEVSTTQDLSESIFQPSQQTLKKDEEAQGLPDTIFEPSQETRSLAEQQEQKEKTLLKNAVSAFLSNLGQKSFLTGKTLVKTSLKEVVTDRIKTKELLNQALQITDMPLNSREMALQIMALTEQIPFEKNNDNTLTARSAKIKEQMINAIFSIIRITPFKPFNNPPSEEKKTQYKK